MMQQMTLPQWISSGWILSLVDLLSSSELPHLGCYWQTVRHLREIGSFEHLKIISFVLMPTIGAKLIRTVHVQL
jgi:hypothetical protein